MIIIFPLIKEKGDTDMVVSKTSVLERSKSPSKKLELHFISYLSSLNEMKVAIFIAFLGPREDVNWNDNNIPPN